MKKRTEMAALKLVSSGNTQPIYDESSCRSFMEITLRNIFEKSFPPENTPNNCGKEMHLKWASYGIPHLTNCQKNLFECDASNSPQKKSHGPIPKWLGTLLIDNNTKLGENKKNKKKQNISNRKIISDISLALQGLLQNFKKGRFLCYHWGPDPPPSPSEENSNSIEPRMFGTYHSTHTAKHGGRCHLLRKAEGSPSVPS